MTASASLKTPRARAVVRPMLVGFFAVYLALLAWSILWKLGMPFIGGGSLGGVKLVPFVSTAEFGVSKPFELVANVLLFVPFGVYLGLLAPTWRWWRAGFLVAGASVALEAVQYVLVVGSADVSDVILNVAGGLIGFGLLALVRRAFPADALGIVSRVMSVATALALLACAAFFLTSPLHYAPPPSIEGSVPMSR